MKKIDKIPYFNKWPNLIRWILFIPISLVFAGISRIVLNLFFGEIGFKFWVHSGTEFLFGFILVYFAVSIVPKYEKIVAISITTILILINILIFIYIIKNADLSDTRDIIIGCIDILALLSFPIFYSINLLGIINDEH